MIPRTHPIVVALACSLAFVACKSNDGEMSDEQKLGYYLENALRFWEMKDIDRTEHQARKGLEVDPENERLRLLLGWTQLRRGTSTDIFAAIDSFEGLLGTDDFRAYLGLAESLERKGLFYDEASREIASGERYTDAPNPEERAIELAGEARDAWQESITRYEETLGLKPRNQQALSGLLRVSALMKHDESSVKWAEELLAELDESGTFWKKQLEREDLTAREEEVYREKIRSSDELESKTRMHVASVLRRLDRNEEALEHLDRVVDVDPDLPEVYSRRAQVLFDLGRYSRALDSLDRFIAVSPYSFEDPAVTAAYELRRECELALSAVRSDG